MSTESSVESGFAELGLPAFLLQTLNRVGYESPTAIQRATIPPLLAGRDIVGMAQTGTGKTAAFALPILAAIDPAQRHIQALVLCPTRELAIQVAEAFQVYAEGLKGFHVLPIYGGQDMSRQLQGLRRGAQVVVATPGRLLDHIKRGSIDLGRIRALVLDEADEMLRMGFIDDVEAILQTTPPKRQVALFSATMPDAIRKVAQNYLREPESIRIRTAASTNEDIEQCYWLVQGTNKLDALTRMLEVEEFDGMIVFVRTRNGTVELADKLTARGFSAAPLNGDMNQALRQRTVEQLRRGTLDILVATDVAARGLDVERISHVMNYDIPYDTEAYVHRIGRTGRAGRSGKAILFVAPRERRLLQAIEKATRKRIERMELPTRDQLLERRAESFRRTIAEVLEQGNLERHHDQLQQLCQQLECSIEDVAAAMALLLQKEQSLPPAPDPRPSRDKPAPSSPRAARPREERETREKAPRAARHDEKDVAARPLADYPDIPMQRFVIRVGHEDGASPREIVGAIASEAELDGKYIGHVRIFDDFSTVDLPGGMPEETMQTLRKTRVCQKPLLIEPMTGAVSVSRQKSASRPEPEKTEKSEKVNVVKKKKKPAEFGERKMRPDDTKKPKKKNRVNKDKGKRRTPSA